MWKKRVILLTGLAWLLIGLVGTARGENLEGPTFTSDPAPATRPLTKAEEVELTNSVDQLTDRSRDAKTKAEAADLLLTRSYPQAAEAIKGLLQDGGNVAAQTAMAEGIARHGGRSEYVGPLMVMLIGADPFARSAAGRALVTYKDPAVMRQMIGLALDTGRDKSARLPAIIALKRVLDKEAVDALVKLLDDRDAAVRDTAMESLEILTNIRDFNEAGPWKAWWEQNKNRDRLEWLTELAESVARTKAALEAENVKLRERLRQALADAYDALSSPATRDAFVSGLLKDPLAEVRLEGLRLARRRVESSGEPLSAEVRGQVRQLLSDGDAPVRESAAATVGRIGDPASVQALMERLAVEDSADVQAALLTALGQLRDARALPEVLPRLNSKYDTVCAAAAKALGWIATKQPLPDEQRQEAVRALVSRYRQASSVSASDGLAVREALLGAMGVLQDKRFLPEFQAACKDASANIRLMAADAIVALKDPAAAESLLPLLNDSDRGVRLMAVKGVASLGGEKYLESVLGRIEPAVESESSVREAAWTAVMGIFAQSGDKVLVSVCDRLRDRDDADVQRAQVLAELVRRLREAKSADLPVRQRELASVLMALRRPAEAAAQLAEVLKNSPSSESAGEVWHEYVDGLLAANDPSVCRVLADQTDEEAFSQGVEKLLLQLEQGSSGDNYTAVMAMVVEARRTLFVRLAPPRQQTLLGIQDACSARQARADKALVSQQVAALAGADEAARSAATTKLAVLGDRAVLPLIDELRKELTAAKPNPDTEKAIVACLKQLAPHLSNYLFTATTAEKIARLDEWTKMATSRPTTSSP